jgi:L-methionine (R)-S-oxide reductase
MNKYQDILKLSLEIIHTKNSVEDKMQFICELLNNKLENYDWTGFYKADIENRILHLGPYTGEATDHTTIPYGKGICGQAAETEKTFLIDDVNAESNYISCNINVKSEIVVPIIRDGVVLGQIDIDSNTAAAFTIKDQNLLEQICTELAPYI